MTIAEFLRKQEAEEATEDVAFEEATQEAKGSSKVVGWLALAFWSVIAVAVFALVVFILHLLATNSIELVCQILTKIVGGK